METKPVTAAARPAKKARDPCNGLRTSATLATALCIIGHIWLGFEQAWMDVVVALSTGYITSIIFESIDAKAGRRQPGFMGGGPKKFFDFLLSAHMSAITTSFIIYTQDHYWPMALAVAIAIGSKYFFRVKIDGRYRHFFNPSNFGIAVVLTVLPWATGIPWMYTADLPNAGNIVIPVIAFFLGLRLNLLYTQRLPTIIAFLVFFVIQGVGRALLLGTHMQTELVPLTGFGMVLFAFYMITDPMTSPSKLRNQIIFGGSIALVYGALLLVNVTYVMFFSVTIVAAGRGVVLFIESLRAEAKARLPKTAAVPAPAFANTAPAQAQLNA